MKLNQAIQDFFHSIKETKKFWVAFSGGLDSIVLLHLLSQLRVSHPLQLHAIHIHHGLSPNANTWLTHCEKICRDWEIDFTAKKIQIQPANGESLEALARAERYAQLAEIIQNDFLLTAHHQDDQAETVLLQLLRGAGPKGLAAMPAIKKLGQGFHARPLLACSRAELKEYAQQHQLPWVEDESNNNENFSRNFLRHRVLPILQQRFGDVTETLTRAAQNCSETENLLNIFIKNDLENARGSQPSTLSISRLRQLDALRQRAVLRAWMIELHFPLPSSVKLNQIQKDMLYARCDRMPHIEWQYIELRRYRDDLFIMPRLQKHSEQFSFPWNFVTPLVLPGIGTLHAIAKPGAGLRADAVTVRFRQSGDTILKNNFHQDLKKFFQEKSIPPWQRDRIPLISVENEIAAIPGYYLSTKFMAAEGEMGYEFVIVREDNVIELIPLKKC